MWHFSYHSYRLFQLVYGLKVVQIISQLSNSAGNVNKRALAHGRHMCGGKTTSDSVCEKLDKLKDLS